MKQYGGLVPNRELQHFITLDVYDGLGILTHYINLSNGSDVLEIWVDSEKDRTVYRYLQVTLSPQKMRAFVEGKLSLRNAVKGSYMVFMIDHIPIMETIKTYMVSTRDLPEEYLSHEDSYESYTMAYVESVIHS